MKLLIEILNAALAAVDPYRAVLNALRVEGDFLQVADAKYNLASFDKIIVVGAGKATARMTLAVESLLGDKISAGLIAVKEGHTAPLNFIEQIEASHPVPNAAGVAATARILEMAGAANEKTLCLCLISGGASALLVAPVADITLQDKQDATRLLLNAGASIHELNAVRKHLSRVKGGQLARVAFPAQVVTLLISDVIGDALDVIASGPTAADGSTFFDAWRVVEKFSLQEKLPVRVVNYLQRGLAGEVAETVRADNICLNKTQNTIVASLHQAMRAAQVKSGTLGIVAKIIKQDLQGEAREAARFLAQVVRDELATMQANETRCLLCGGETTVTVRGNGMGGRNQELALAFALEIAGLQGVKLLSAGTDGSDGANDAAGAMVEGDTVATARRLGLEAMSFLDNNDSYTFFQNLDAATGGHAHFKPGATGTNVMDMQIVLLHKI
ncbi:MAG: glycerate kinase [Gallionella sp.]